MKRQESATSNYSFQNDLVAQIETELQKSNRVILAACVGAGKTMMANKVMTGYKRVLVLAHGQDILRRQFGKEAKEYGGGVIVTEINRAAGFKDIKDLDEGIFVTLPQTAHKVKNLGHFDLLVVDEAHQFYNADMVQAIINKLPGVKQLLLSASPFSLRSLGLPEISYTLDKALERGIMSNAQIEILVSSYDYDLEDFNDNDNLKEEVELNEEQTNTTMDMVMTTLLDRLSSRIDNKTLRNILDKVMVSKLINKLDKTIIASASIAHAEMIAKYLTKNEIKHYISHSSNDVDSDQIDQFKRDEDTKILIVVARARLGFNMPSLVNMVDLSGTLNPTLLYQMLGRVTRRHPDNKPKRFFKATPMRLHYYSHAVMCVTAGLCTESFFRNYDENMYKRIKIPQSLIPSEIEPKEEVEPRGTRKGKKEKPVEPITKSLVDLAKTCEVFNKINYNASAVLETSEYVTLQEVRQKLTGLWKPYFGSYENMLKFVKELGINSLTDWRSIHRSSYNYASDHAILRKIADDLRLRIRRDHYTYESLKEIARQFNRPIEWRKGDNSSYTYACTNNIHHKIAEELGWDRKAKERIYNSLKDIAKQFNGLKEWEKGYYGSYQRASKHKIQRQIAEELGWEVNTFWNYETALAEAAKYTQLKEWQVKSKGSYKWALKNKVQRKIGEELGWKMQPLSTKKEE